MLVSNSGDYELGVFELHCLFYLLNISFETLKLENLWLVSAKEHIT
jgi:hypothetical protein